MTKETLNENNDRYKYPFVDIIISGDKHFLELEMEYPRSMSIAKFLDEVQ